MKFIWLTWLFACYPLGSAEFDYSVIIGMPKANVPCRFEVENNDCDPRDILSRERIRRK